MTDPAPHLQVIRSVHSRGYGRSRLVLQSVCGKDGRRYLRAAWEYLGDDDVWRQKNAAPEFNASVWADVIAKAARAGMLSSTDYKTLLVRLAQGLDSSKSPTPKAFVRFTGSMILQVPTSVVAEGFINEIAVYDALNAPSRDVTVTQNLDSTTDTYTLEYVVEEDIHYMEALSRLPNEVRDLAVRSSLEEAISSSVPISFLGLFGDPGIASAGFGAGVEVDYSLAVL